VQNSRSREISAAAHVVALAWCASFFWFYFFYGSGETWGYAIIDGVIAWHFWRKSRHSLFALPLFYILFGFVFLNLASTLMNLSDWWLAFLFNRLFEIELLYIVSCSVYRMRKLRHIKKGRSFRSAPV